MKYIIPQSMEELFSCLNNSDNYYILNGGSDLLVNLDNLNKDYPIIDITNISSLKGYELNTKQLTINSCCKYYQILNDKQIKNNYNGIYMAATEIGSVQIRNIASICGNIINSSPGGDMAVILAALKSNIFVQDNNNEYVYTVDEFITGYKTNLLKTKEILCKIEVSSSYKYSYFKKYGLNHNEKVIISNVSIGVAFNVYDNKLTDVSFYIGACSVKQFHAISIESYLNNKGLSTLDRYKLYDEAKTCLSSLTNKEFYNMKIGHLLGCVDDLYNYIISILKESTYE